MSVTVRPYKKRGREGWEVDIRFDWPDGDEYRERRKAPVTGKAAAKRWAEAREAELLRQGKPSEKVVVPKAEVPTVEDFMPRFIRDFAVAERQKSSTVDSKERIIKRHLLPRLGAKRLDEITVEDIQKLKADFADNELTSKTTNNVLSVLGKALRIAVEWKVIPHMPCEVRLLKITDTPQMKFYEKPDFERLVEAAGKLGHHVLVMVLLGGEAGLRRGEITALRQHDVDLRRRQMTVSRGEWEGVESTTKGGRKRVIPLTKRLADALIKNRHLRGDRVLYQVDGRPTDANCLEGWMMATTRRAQLEPTGGLHILRHTFCSHLAMKGAPTKAIQELAGHKELVTTMRYMHLSPATRQAAIALLDQEWAEEARGDMLETGPGQGSNPLESSG